MIGDIYKREMLRYEPDRTASAYRSGITTVADPVNVSSLGSIPVYSLQVEGPPKESGKTTLLIHARYSNSTGTSSLWVAKGFINTYALTSSTYANTFNVLVIEPLDTAFAAETMNDGSTYWSAEQIVDVVGNNHVKVMSGGTNVGTMQIWLRRI